MTKIKVHTRSFHPRANFGAGGLGFEGDDRGFSDSEGSTSRIKHYFTINLVARSIENIVCASNASKNTVLPAIGTAAIEAAKSTNPVTRRIPTPRLPPMQNDYTEARKQPRQEMRIKEVGEYRKDGDQYVRVVFSYAGQNFAFYGANTDPGHAVYSTVVPDLDVTHDFSLRINRGAKKAIMISSIGGDGFPNCEAFMMDPAKAPCFISTHIRVGTAMTQLPGGRTLAMMKSSYELEWNDGDLFGSAMQIYSAIDYTGSGTAHELAPSGGTTRSAWNAANRTRDATGDWLRRTEDHVPTGRQLWRDVRDGYDRVSGEIGRALEGLGKPRF